MAPAPATMLAAGLWALASICGSPAAAQNGLSQTSVCTPSPVAEDHIGARFDSLIFRGGLHLESNHVEFGGLSGLTVSLAAPTGDSLAAVSDRGYAVDIETTLDNGRLVNARCAQTALVDTDGAPVGGRRRDAEGVALLASGGRAVSFERRHRIDYFDGPNAPARAGPAIGQEAALDYNRSLEAITILPGGDMLAASESPSILATPHPVWRFAATQDADHPFADSDGPAFRVAARRGYGLSGMEATPSGDLLLLERFWSVRTGHRIAVSRLRRDAMRGADGDTVRPELLLRWTSSDELPIDNFEGIAASVGVDRRTRIWLVSDDNLNTDRRTLLYLFELDEEAAQAR